MIVWWMDGYEWLHLMIKSMDDYLVDGHIQMTRFNEKANGWLPTGWIKIQRASFNEKAERMIA